MREHTGAELEHVGSYSFDPGVLTGNVEQFVGVAQVPIGLAGPAARQRRARAGRVLRPARDRRGHAGRQLQPRHAPAARGRRRDDDDHGRPHAARARRSCSPAPARRARSRRGSTSTSTRSRRRPSPRRAPASCRRSRSTPPSRILYTRFNYTTGDAAGQNLTGKATQAACRWIDASNDTHRALLPRVELRDRQEELAGQHAPHARQAGHRRGDDPQRALPARHALGHRPDVPGAPGLEPRRLHVGRQQQRRPLGQRHHGDVHRHRPGRRERRGVLSAPSSTPSCARTATTTTR